MKVIDQAYRKQFATFLVFLTCALLIVVLHLLFHHVRVLGMDTSIFYMDEKYTLAAFFTSLVAFLTGYIALSNISDIGYGLFFLILSIDEYFEVHEYTNTLIKESLRKENVFKSLADFSWIFPLSLVILAVFILLILKIKKSTGVVRNLMIIGSLCFFLVLIFELLGAATFGHHIYLYYVAAEEGLEMIGVSFFLLATLVETKS